MSASAVDNVWRWGGRAIWLLVIVLTGGIYFANHNLPKGPLVDTGDVVCQNDDQGPCGEQYIEDTQRLNISAEAKFLKGSEAEILLLGLVFTGIFASKRPSGGYTKKSDGY